MWVFLNPKHIFNANISVMCVPNVSIRLQIHSTKILDILLIADINHICEEQHQSTHGVLIIYHRIEQN